MTRRELASASFGAAALALAIFCAGGAPRWAMALVALCTAGALIPLVPSRRVASRRPALLVLIAVALAWTLLQLLPLPGALVHWLNPTGSGLRSDGAALFGTTPASSISLDRAGTLTAAGYFLVLLGLAIVAMRLSLTERGRYYVIATVAALCGLAALVTAADELLDMSFFIYKLQAPLQTSTRTVAPLLNNNHFGSLMAVGTVISLGLVTYRNQVAWLRAVWLGNAALCGVEVLDTLSRGAALALGLGLFVLVAVLVAQRFVAQETPSRRRASLLTMQLPIGVVAVCTVVVVLYASSEGVSQQLSATTLDELHAPRSKFAAWRSGFTLIEESPWVGVGRGAMEPVLTHVHPASAYASYSHLENEYLQAVVDFGIPGAVVIGVACLWLGLTSLKRWRDGPLAAAAFGGVSVVLLQSNVDFGAEILGVAGPLIALIATIAYTPVNERKPKQLAPVRAARIGLIVSLGLAAIVLFSSATTSVQEDHYAIAHDQHVTFADLRGPAARHPLDFYNYEVAAQLAIRAHDPNAVRFLNHALVLNPFSSGLHLMAARLLYDTKHIDQAAVEYAAALPGIREWKPTLQEIATKFSPELAAAAIPIDVASLRQISRMLDEIGHADIKTAWLQRVLDLQPTALQACDLLYEAAGQHGAANLVALARRRCGSYLPNEDRRLALAHALLTDHANAEIVQVLADVESWRGLASDKGDAWMLLCDAYTELAQWDDALRCVHRLDASGLIAVDRAGEIAKRLEKIRDLRDASVSGSGSAHP